MLDRVVFDIEANGLLDTATHLWCIAAYNMDKDEWLTGTIVEDGSIEKVIEYLSRQYTCLIGHNILGYDIPLLARCYDFPSPKFKLDTYVVSRLLNPDRGFHSLKEWAKKLGKVKKVEQEQWDKWDSNMLIRCKEDVRITVKLYRRLCTDAGVRDLVEEYHYG